MLFRKKKIKTFTLFITRIIYIINQGDSFIFIFKLMLISKLKSKN